ncbi:interferon-induced protein 44-like [Mercenaria mercenaria]|uniref:interferon-induced protein 44-like n=1 Tax=Mercenaria mercenaria TaxID=6596 RepID=UPI00234E7C6F|nr:interferon-induced protein 44-like [Mercenaria mercenaria]
MGGGESKPEVVYEERVVYREPFRPNTPPLVDPWRNIKGWTNSFSESLLSEIQENKTGSVEVKNPGLLLLGPINAGKSTFVNSICSIGKGRLVNKAYTGAAGTSLTTSFKRFRGAGFLRNFRLCDTMGVEDGENEGFHVSDVVNLIEGHVKDTYKFNPRHPLTPEDQAYNPCPQAKEKIHCVIFVIDAAALGSGSISNDLKRKIQCLQDEIKVRNIPRVLILTKVDLLCEKVLEDIQNIFKSTKVQKAVKRAAEIFAIPESNIHPLKNYEGEIEIDPIINIPLLLALRQIMHFASDFLEEDDEDSD